MTEEPEIVRAAMSIAHMVDEWTQRGWNDEGREKFAKLVERRLKRFWPDQATLARPDSGGVEEAIEEVRTRFFNTRIEPNQTDPITGPWFVIDQTTAEPEVNWPGELIHEATTKEEARAAADRWCCEPLTALLVSPKVDNAPVPMILHCPACGLQHIDGAIEVPGHGMGSEWTNPPHRSHLCHGCGHMWRPADVATEGVAEIKTKGSADSPKPPDIITRFSEALGRQGIYPDCPAYNDPMKALKEVLASHEPSDKL